MHVEAGNVSQLYVHNCRLLTVHAALLLQSVRLLHDCEHCRVTLLNVHLGLAIHDTPATDWIFEHAV